MVVELSPVSELAVGVISALVSAVVSGLVTIGVTLLLNRGKAEREARRAATIEMRERIFAVRDALNMTVKTRESTSVHVLDEACEELRLSRNLHMAWLDPSAVAKVDDLFRLHGAFADAVTHQIRARSETATKGPQSYYNSIDGDAIRHAIAMTEPVKELSEYFALAYIDSVKRGG